MSAPLVDAAVKALEAARDEQAAVVAREQAKLAQLEEALNALSADIAVGAVPARQDFRRMGIVEATERLLEERGTPLETREIADVIRARGVETKSKNFIPTVYATLANSAKFERRDG